MFYDANSLYLGGGEPAEQPLTMKAGGPVVTEIPIADDIAAAAVTARIGVLASDGSRLVRLVPMEDALAED